MNRQETTADLSARIVTEIARHEGVPPTAVQPVLFDVVDPDALADLFHSPDGGPERDAGAVRFPIGDYEVTVAHDGSVDVEAATDGSRVGGDVRGDGGRTGPIVQAELD